MFLSILTTIALVIIGVLLFLLIIFFHEGGHFLAAKLSGVQVNEFSLGMGPKIFSFKKGETQYSLRALPIGGYCAMEGEDEDSDNPRAFNNAKVWKRMIIIIAGAVMNILLGFILMFTVVVQKPVYNSTTVSAFTPRAYTAKSGLQAGDKIVKLNNYSIYTDMDLSFALATTKLKDADASSLSVYKEQCTNVLCDTFNELVSKPNIKNNNDVINDIYNSLCDGADKINNADTKESVYKLYKESYKNIKKSAGNKEYKIPEIKKEKKCQRFVTDAEVIRNGKRITVKDVHLSPNRFAENNEQSVSIDFFVEPVEKNFGTVMQQTGSQTVSTVRSVWASLIGLVKGQFSFKEISGPVGAASAITQMASEGLKSGFGDAVNNIVFVMIIITVNLGIFNMLPFPALDGGRFLFLLIEAIFRKPIPRKVEKIVNAAGLAILLIFMAVITFKDVWQLLPIG